MEPTAIPTPVMSRSSRRFGLLALTLCLALPLILVACEILEVTQPGEAEQGETIEVTLDIGGIYPDANPSKGYVSVLVPDDWAYVSGTYTGSKGSGDMEATADWADSTEIVLPAPDGMKWISAISDQGYTADENDSYTVTLQLLVGQTTGDFNLGYFTSTEAYATKDVDLDNGGQGNYGNVTADTTMNQPMTVRMATSAEDGPGDGVLTLKPNAPNPFQSATQVRYALARSADVTVRVFDMQGRQLEAMPQGLQSAGAHAVDFDAAGLASGTYLSQVWVDGRLAGVQRMTLAR